MNYKKSAKIFFLFLIIFIMYHSVMWLCVTKNIFNRYDNLSIGDLGRMSYKHLSYQPRKTYINIANRHKTLNSDYIPTNIDVITIGDSFSNGGGGGLNPYYQDYISDKYDLKILNINLINGDYFLTLFSLINSNYFDKLNPKYIILESVERSSIERFAQDMQKYENSFNQIIQKNTISKNVYRPSFINALNYNALIYTLLYKFDDNAFFSKVYYSKLTKNLFTSSDSNGLLFYHEDIKNVSKSNDSSIEKLNLNLNKIQKILDKYGTKLYFMPVVDKYNLYSKYIKDNPYPESVFFEKLRNLEKQYVFIDTKLILSKLLEKDVKDVYYSDDTHWSHKASEEIVRNMNFKK